MSIGTQFSILAQVELAVMVFGIFVFALCTLPVAAIRRAGFGIARLCQVELRSPFGVPPGSVSLYFFMGSVSLGFAAMKYLAWYRKYVQQKRPKFTNLGVEREYMALKWRGERDLYMYLFIGVLYIALHVMVRLHRQLKDAMADKKSQ